jgi:hypothetical protein
VLKGKIVVVLNPPQSKEKIIREVKIKELFILPFFTLENQKGSII